MYNLETVESLHAYAGRLHRDMVRTTTSVRAPKPPVRHRLRKLRRTS